MLAAEGFFALTLPLVIGPWSDTFHTPLGRRRPFMLAALGPMAFTLALLAFMPNLWTTALMLFGLFFAYYVYEPPYRGLYPDVLPESVYGRAQGVQHFLPWHVDRPDPKTRMWPDTGPRGTEAPLCHHRVRRVRTGARRLNYTDSRSVRRSQAAHHRPPITSPADP